MTYYLKKCLKDYSIPSLVCPVRLSQQLPVMFPVINDYEPSTAPPSSQTFHVNTPTMASAAALALIAAPAFPSFPPRQAITLVSPETGSVIVPTGAEASANVTLRYAMNAPAAKRLCLELKRGALQYYRGPLIRRATDPSLAAYAKGCYAPGQPVTIAKLPIGSYALHAMAEDGFGGILGEASSVFAVSRSHEAKEVFTPSYEWAAVGPEQSIPSGLEVRLSLSDHRNETDTHANPPRYARIPPSWRLQVYLGHGHGFSRVDVRRDSTIDTVEHAIRSSLAQHRAASQ